MITGEKKQQVDNIWQIFWNSGFTQPSAIFEQITYLLFMKMLDEKQLEKESIANLTGDKLLNPTFPEGDWHNPSTDQDIPYNELRWHIFKEFEPSHMLNRVRNDVFIFLRSIGGTGSAYSKAMEDTVFQITNARLLSRVVEGIEELASDGADMMGDVYEYMLGKMAASGTNGQFRTPRHIIRMMVELMKPTLDDTICDPAMGSAGFIMEAAKYIQEHQSDELLNIETMNRFRSEIFHGSDSDASMMRIGCMNMMLHDVDEPQLYYRNSLSDENNDTNKYTLCLANPPFAGSLDQDDIAPSLRAAVKTKKTELLFLALMMRMLQAGGRCASIVPDTVLTGDAQAYKTIRSALVDDNCLQAVITMPSGVFQPYSGALSGGAGKGEIAVMSLRHRLAGGKPQPQAVVQRVLVFAQHEKGLEHLFLIRGIDPCPVVAQLDLAHGPVGVQHPHLHGAARRRRLDRIVQKVHQAGGQQLLVAIQIGAVAAQG